MGPCEDSVSSVPLQTRRTLPLPLFTHVCGLADTAPPPRCSNATQGGGAFQYKVPSGVILDEQFLPNLPKYVRAKRVRSS